MSSVPAGLVYVASPRPPVIPSVQPVIEAAANLRAGGASVFFWAEEFARSGGSPDTVSTDPEVIVAAATWCMDKLSRSSVVMAWPGTEDCPVGRVTLIMAEAFGIPVLPLVPAGTVLAA